MKTIEEMCDEFHKEIEVVKDYDFCLNDIYADSKGNKITFESIYMRGAKDMSTIELNNIEDHISGAKMHANMLSDMLATIQWALNEEREGRMETVGDIMKHVQPVMKRLKLHLNAIQKDENES